MPRWNCSPLQRFATCIDLQSIENKKYPEAGPLIWKKKAYNGIKRDIDEESFQRLYIDNGRKRNQALAENKRIRQANRKERVSKQLGMKGLNLGTTPKAEPIPKAEIEKLPDYTRLSTVKWYPVFFVDGGQHNAIRWLFFQMYDDQALLNKDRVWNVVKVPNATKLTKRDKEALKERFSIGNPDRFETKRENDIEWQDVLGRVMPVTEIPYIPGYQRQFSLYHNQENLKVRLAVFNPWTSKLREHNTFYYHWKKIDGITLPTVIGDYSGPHLAKHTDNLCDCVWNDYRRVDKWVDMATNKGATTDSPYREENNPYREMYKKRYGSMKAHKKIAHVFPQVIDGDRMDLVRHYLRGGTDADNPFIQEETW